MAAPLGTENPGLEQQSSPEALAVLRKRLYDEPWTFEFFQAVRILERLRPERAAVGRFANPGDEAVRFAVNPALTFPPSAIHGLDAGANPPLMTVNFFGLTGPVGALPNYMSELVSQRMRGKDRALRDFLDVFNHRLISLFYQAWEKHHFAIGYERDFSDPLTGYVLGIAGLGQPSLRNRQAVRDELFVFYSGLLSLAPKSAAAMEAVLGDYFDVPVEVEPFIGTWRKIDRPDQCFVGQETESELLGWGATIGDEVWDQQSRIRIRIGPLNAEQYQDFLPSGTGWPALQALAKIFCGNDLEFEIQLILERQEVPSCTLGDPASDGPALGWQTWLKSKPTFERNGTVVVGG